MSQTVGAGMGALSISSLTAIIRIKLEFQTGKLYMRMSPPTFPRKRWLIPASWDSPKKGESTHLALSALFHPCMKGHLADWMRCGWINSAAHLCKQLYTNVYQSARRSNSMEARRRLIFDMSHRMRESTRWNGSKLFRWSTPNTYLGCWSVPLSGNCWYPIKSGVIRNPLPFHTTNWALIGTALNFLLVN